uniref:Carotene globule protein n=1 Tax=Dunaliella salina TaxID=3046 RepID=V5J1A2_DUNSA|nr:carotene globule protein [Dunaliella salina]
MQLGSQMMLSRGCAQPQKVPQQLTPVNLQRPSPVARGSTNQGKQSHALPSAAPVRGVQNKNLAIPRAAATEAVTTTRTSAFDINEAIKKLRADLDNQMSTGVPSPDLYGETVIFRDPMARVNGLKDYTDFLKLNLAIKPTFELHDLRPCGPYTAVMRWTMYFPVVPDQLPRPWTPKATFTGTTTYGFSPATQKINAHVDTWDLTDQQDWFSRDAVATLTQQMAADAIRPGPVEGYKLMRLRPDYEIRDYAPSAVSEAFKEGETEISPSVFLDGPAPEAGKLLGGTVAARRFAGSPPNWLLGMAKPEDEAKKLMDALRRDGVPFDESAGYRLVRYDGPNPLPQGKPNDVLVKVDPSYNPVWFNEDEIESKHRFHYKTAK